MAFDGDPTGADDQLIARGSGGPLTEIARADGSRNSTQVFDGFTSDLSLNNLGRVAFTAFDDEFGNEALYTGRGGPLTEVATTDGDLGELGYSSFGGRGPSLNDLGRVAFQADLDDFVSSGVFTGPNPVSDAVARCSTPAARLRPGLRSPRKRTSPSPRRSSGRPRAGS